MTNKQEIELQVEPRKIHGRKVKALRREGLIPGNVFGGKLKSASVQVKKDEFLKVFKEAGETNIVNLTIEGKKEHPVLITNIHKNPVTDEILHVDFHQIDLSKKVTADIPLDLIGVSPAAEEKGAVIVQLVNEIEIEALPTELPDHLEIDITALKEFGDSLSVKDIKAPGSVEIKNDPEQQIVQAQEPKEEVIEEPTPEAEGEAAAEGETPAENAEAEKTE